MCVLVVGEAMGRLFFYMVLISTADYQRIISVLKGKILSYRESLRKLTLLARAHLAYLYLLLFLV